jgi:hypothetical protein
MEFITDGKYDIHKALKCFHYTKNTEYEDEILIKNVIKKYLFVSPEITIFKLPKTITLLLTFNLSNNLQIQTDFLDLLIRLNYSFGLLNGCENFFTNSMCYDVNKNETEITIYTKYGFVDENVLSFNDDTTDTLHRCRRKKNEVKLLHCIIRTNKLHFIFYFFACLNAVSNAFLHTKVMFDSNINCL